MIIFTKFLFIAHHLSLITTLANLIFLILCLLIGVLLKQFKVLPTNAHVTLNNLILYICLPATSLIYASTIEFEAKYILAILMPWLLYGGSFLFFRVLRNFTKIDHRSEGVLIMTAGIPSISFLGFPLFQMLYGETGLQIGVLMSQAGSFLACGTVGVITASLYSSENPSYSKIAKDVLTFPTFIAFCIAITMNVFDVSFSESITEILKKLSSPFSFLALVSIGLQIELNHKALQKANLKWGFLYKLILCPLVIFLLYFVILGKTDVVAQTCVIGAALGSMNMAAVVALRYGLNPTLAAQMVGIGIPVSLLGVGFWYLVFQMLGYI
jgi:malate permease and related proteins